MNDTGDTLHLPSESKAPRRRPGRARTAVASVLITSLGSLYLALVPAQSIISPTGGIHDSGIQELDGSIDFTPNTTAYGTTTHDTATETAAPYDWNSLFTAAGTGGSISTAGAQCQVGGSCAGLVNDAGLPYTGDLFTKGSKDTNDISTWSCTQQSTPPKDELVNAYGAAWTAQQNAGVITAGDSLLFLGLERPNTKGNSNAGFWLFKNTVVCDAATGTFTGSHSNGDVFIVGSFVGGGTSAVLTATQWVCRPVSSTNPTCASTGALSNTSIQGSLACPAITVNTDVFCEVVNQSISSSGAITNWDVHTPWSNIATGGTGPGDIPGPGFLEMGIDLSQAFSGPGVATSCFASFLTDTRSSGSSTQAETKNFINGRFATCGSASVHKYIDTNLNGAYDASSDITATGVPAVSMTVTGPGGQTICSGSSGGDGNLSCASGSLANLPAGTYSVTETQIPGFYNTDPGTGGTCNDTPSGSTSPPDATDVNEAATVACTFQVANGGSNSIHIGNQCVVGMTFQVSGIPAGTTGVYATWSVAGGYDVGKHSSSVGTGNLADVALTANAQGVYTGTSTFPFIQNDTVNWSFYINNDPTHTEAGNAGASVSLTGNVFSATTGVTACGNTSTGVFAPSSIEGFKYKDVTGTGLAGDGSVPPGDRPLGGVAFQLLVSGTATVVGTATSTASDGSFSFANVNPGTYQVQEVVPAGWVQTAPVASGVATDYTVTVHLGDTSVSTDDSGRTLNFLDTPTYDFSAAFHSDAALPGTSTQATHGAINCSPNPDSSVTGTATFTSGTVPGASATYSCTIVVTDP